ncbi:class I SAM-dependent methyltransferase [Modestobacter sp. Leaf380]|uniref:class I SAM-dependent methyltransferase n=1 Tax=Modestobacter sp. Leaf380 TaxID=1736356 RepID=UPI0009E81E91|nr:class I SAM-dependent methyltransferase [Modestobacter sp. Leaf380]
MTAADAPGRPGWLLDQVASAGRENLDAGHVARYDAIEDAAPDREVALLQRWGMDGDSVVVELGTGTGQFALAAARVCGRVVAVDVSPVMIAELEAKLRRSGLENVTVVQAGFLDYQHQGPPADVVYSRYAMHHLPDFWKGVALARIRDALRPGGVLRVWDVVWSFEVHEAEERLEAWCATGGPDGGDGWSRADFEEHVRDEHSTFTWLFEALAERAGLVLETAEYSADGVFAEYVFSRPDGPVPETADSD